MNIIIIKHPVHAEITNEECLAALPTAATVANQQIIEIMPDRLPLGETINDWNQLELVQRKQYFERLQPLIDKFPGAPIYYFGFAPIPLIVHLGSLIDNWHQVYPMFRIHDTKEWRYELPSANTVQYTDNGLPHDENLADGDVALNISVSRKVDRKVTAEAVGESLMKSIDFEVVNPKYDNLYLQQDLIEFGKKIDDIVQVMQEKFPNLSTLHLFASVPIPVAFVIGHRIQPNIYPVIQTYQHKNTADKPFQAAIVVNRRAEDQVIFTDDQQQMATEYRKDWNKMLTGRVRRFISTLEGRPPGYWFQLLSPQADWSSFNTPYWRNLEPLTKNQLLVQDKINLVASTVANGFDYDQAVYEWSLDTSLFVALQKRFNSGEEISKAGRLFLFHETLHYSCHKINSQIAEGIGSFPKVIEESDYQADVYALLHDYAYSKLFDDNFSSSHVKTWFLETINVMTETMWSFDDNGNELNQIQIRRMNRFLIWYWQAIRIKYANSENDIFEILSEKPVIEFSGLLVTASNQRVFYNLKRMEESIPEIAIYAKGKITRTTPPNFQKLIEGFRKLDGALIMSTLEMMYSIIYK